MTAAPNDPAQIALPSLTPYSPTGYRTPTPLEQPIRPPDREDETLIYIDAEDKGTLHKARQRGKLVSGWWKVYNDLFIPPQVH